MSQKPAKVRLVRCPKCENLLPEVTDYAVYQCGGCGAVLRAKNKHMDSGVSSEKSGDETDVVPNKIFQESVNLDVSNRTFKNMSLGSENGFKSSGSCSRRPEKGDNSINFEESRSRRSVGDANWRFIEPDHQEGSRSYHNTPLHEYAELVQHTNDLEVDDDQVELLRKLEELKYEIVRSRNKSHMHQPNHPLIANMNQVKVFSDPFGSQNHRRNQVIPFDHNPYRPYYSGTYVSSDLTDNRPFHHPSCSCLACYSKHQQAPPPPPPPQLPVATPVLQNDPLLYRHDFNLSMKSHNSEQHTRWSTEIRRPPRRILATGVRRCHPMVGGSPFVACCKCFELLQVPNKRTKRMRCAACSAVILLSVVNKRLVLSVYTETDQDPDNSKYDHRTRGDARSGGTEFSSEDFDNSGSFDFEPMDKLPLRGLSLTSYKSALSYTSEEEIKVNIIIDDNPVDAALNANKPSPPPSGSPLRDHFGYSTKYNRAGKGNVSRRSAMERAEKFQPVNSGSHGTPVKDAAEASEIEISSNEYSVNMGTSLESGDTSRETYHQRGNGSFFVGMIKKSFREFSRSGQHVDHGKVNVTVNGHPIPDRLVKKAEKLAGPVQPGDYWYDSKAGFWGMMGRPCRGIIPSHIEEFSYPMPEKCADGNTNVFVNGRELHQSDLDLLVSRGLPAHANRSYTIDISGNVFDEVARRELVGLGKLAPTVELKKIGFGMKPPKAIAV